jgi:guanylate kinase
MSEKGLIVVISAPSGTGKGTVIKKVRERHEKFEFSVSVTTRPRREGEREGVEYFYVSEDSFGKMIENDELIEWVRYCGNYYGTPRKYVEDCCGSGRDVFLDIEVEGALNIKRMYPDSVHIFMLPPSIDELKRRINKRGTESAQDIEKRINKALSELLYLKEYDYVFFNSDVTEAVESVLTILRAEKMKVDRNKNIMEKIEGI